jgi:thymidylate synthase
MVKDLQGGDNDLFQGRSHRLDSYKIIYVMAARTNVYSFRYGFHTGDVFIYHNHTESLSRVQVVNAHDGFK